LLLVIFQYAGIPLIIISYVLSIVSNKFLLDEKKNVKRKDTVSRRAKKKGFFSGKSLALRFYLFCSFWIYIETVWPIILVSDQITLRKKEGRQTYFRCSKSPDFRQAKL
jgi:hypothetical protein